MPNTSRARDPTRCARTSTPAGQRCGDPSESRRRPVSRHKGPNRRCSIARRRAVLLSIVGEIAFQQAWNIYFILEGAPFQQSERGLFTNGSRGRCPTRLRIYARTGLTTSSESALPAMTSRLAWRRRLSSPPSSNSARTPSRRTVGQSRRRRALLRSKRDDGLLGPTLQLSKSSPRCAGARLLERRCDERAER